MNRRLEDRLGSLMQAAAPDLQPDPALGRLAAQRGRTSRRRRWVAAPLGGAAALVVGWAVVVVALHGADDVLAVDDAGRLRQAPDWAGCQRTSLDDLPAVPARTLPDDATAVALCGEVQPGSMTVWVAGAADADAVVAALAGSDPGRWFDTCAYSRCVSTRFAVLGGDGTVYRLEITHAVDEGGYAARGVGRSWIVTDDTAEAILGLAGRAAEFVYTIPPSAPEVL